MTERRHGYTQMCCHCRMMDKMPAEREASKRNREREVARRRHRYPWRKHKGYETRRTRRDNGRHGLTHKSHERARRRKSIRSDGHERPERYQVMETQGSVKRSLSAGPQACCYRMAAIKLKTILSVISVNQSGGVYTAGSLYTNTPSQRLSAYPRRDLHTPCTAPGCSTGHLLKAARGNTMFLVGTPPKKTHPKKHNGIKKEQKRRRSRRICNTVQDCCSS